ncbi:hypothetical protein [Pedobacter cryotolerans]|uniref:Uncharacterized protein n=1 Tax=Pedobacter cryotolerans TaxID=2571270 RepID=A0A4U1BUU9_9SPHI|nr:hypothetical protein [Pedobacter cryotolerans]TKB96450.1 hypothetical protein FA045_18355 [Pedobacter cryotolerans]
MKKTMLSLAIAIGLFAASCSNEKKEEGAHQHEDGSTHADHDETPVDTTKQEEFKVDSVAADTAAHSHDDGKSHTH